MLESKGVLVYEVMDIFFFLVQGDVLGNQKDVDGILDLVCLLEMWFGIIIIQGS